MIYGTAKAAGLVFPLKKCVLVITFRAKAYKDKWKPIIIYSIILFLLLLLLLLLWLLLLLLVLLLLLLLLLCKEEREREYLY